MTGEMAVIDKKPRSADIVAHTDTVLLKLPAADFDNLLDSHGKVARGMLLVMADRLRRSQCTAGKGGCAGGGRTARGDTGSLGSIRSVAAPPAIPSSSSTTTGLISADLDLPFSISFGHESQTLPLRDIVPQASGTPTVAR